MLDRAKAYLQRVMDHLAPQIDAGVPIVVLEPSCASVFRDELRNLFPTDARADRLRKQTFLLSEFLERHAPDFQPPRLERSVLLHGHCHHKALMKMTDEESLLKKMGAQVTAPDAGCCGMAGPFGFDADKVRRVDGDRRARAAARRAQRAGRHADRLGRLQLPRTDLPGDGTKGAAPRRKWCSLRSATKNEERKTNRARCPDAETQKS